MKYWIGVASKDHVMRGVKLGIAQIGHGKHHGLVRMHAGDGLVYYSPKERLEDGSPLQAFTAAGYVVDDELWQADEGDFRPWRRRVAYSTHCHSASIRPLLNVLSVTRGKQNWGYVFRYGLVEITETDFDGIMEAMKDASSD